MSFDHFEALSVDFTEVAATPQGADPFDIPRADLSYGSQASTTVAQQAAPLAAPAAAVAATLATAAVIGAVTRSKSDDELAATDDETKKTDKPAPNVHARRRKFAAAVLAVMAVMWYQGDLKVPSAVSSLGITQAAMPGQPNQQTVAKANAMLTSMLDQSEGIRQATGTFRNITFPQDVQSIASDHMLVLSVVIDGSCWYAAIMPGLERVPRWDQTATRCSLNHSKLP